MTMLRRGLAAACAAALVLPSVSAAAGGYSVQAMTFDVTVGPAGDTHCTIDADLYRPDGASVAHPVPAIMATNGFGGDKTGFATLGPSYARHGYAFLAYSGLGFGKSGCRIFLDDPDWDGRAGSQLVTFLGQRDWILHDTVAHDGKHHEDDPRLGMLNGSYGGEIQFAVAAVDPRLDAISPDDTWHDLAFSLAPNNADLTTGLRSSTPGVMKSEWPAAFFAYGQLGLASGDPSRLGPCPGYADWVCAALASGLANGYPDAGTVANLRHASVTSYIAKIRIPTLLTQGQHDTLFGLQEAIATYEALRAQGTPVRMVWQSAGHSGGNLGTSEIDWANPEGAYQSRMELEWFEWFLKGAGDPPALDVSFFRDWVPYTGDAAPAVGSAPGYPVGGERSLYLSGTDQLVTAPEAVTAGEAQMAAGPAPASTGGGAADAGSADAPGTSVSYTSAALPADLDVAGVPRLALRVDAPTFAQSQGTDPGGKLVLFAKLYDVAPDGGATSIANLVTAARIGDVTKPVSIALSGIVHRFAKGHRLRLTLSTGASAYKGNTASGPVTIAVGPQALARLALPVLGAPTGPAGSGPSGTTPFTDAKGASTPQTVPPASRPRTGRTRSAATLPRRASCRTDRRLRIRLRPAARGDRLARLVVTVDGRRKLARTGRHIRRSVVLHRLPRGAFRLAVTTRSRRGQIRLSARQYVACPLRRGAR